MTTRCSPCRPLLVVGALLSGIPVLAPASPPAASRALRIVSDRPLPEVLHDAADIRWASDESLYLALGRRGVVEAPLALTEGALTEIIPGELKPGGFWGSYRLAASAEYVAAAGPFYSVTWRRLAAPQRSEEGGFDYVADIDAWGDRLVVLAARRDGDTYSPDGAIGWLGSLAAGLTDLRPILYDARGPRAPNFANCTPFDLGKVRFLADGTLLLVPGVQPGTYLYDAGGKLMHAWDTADLGIDTDCAAISQETALRLDTHLGQRFTWVNHRQVVDETLPLPQGPGLVLRRVESGTTRWRLIALSRGAPPQAYDLPLEANGVQVRLRGDVRGRLMALLLAGPELDSPLRQALPRLVVAEVPGAE